MTNLAILRNAVYAAVTGAVLLGASVAVAQTGGGDGYLFEQPKWNFTIDAGYAHATASGGVFDYITSELSLKRGNFSGAEYGVDAAKRISPRVDLELSLATSATYTLSHYAGFVQGGHAQIRQKTYFHRIPIMLSAKAYVAPQGHPAGRFAWVPARFAPYVGAGVGAMWYKLGQRGAFIDFTNNGALYEKEFTSATWTPAAQGFVGVDMTLTSRIALTGQATYIWGRGTLSQTLSPAHDIDLSGISATGGLTLRY